MIKEIYDENKEEDARRKAQAEEIVFSELIFI